jgi:hypothetical protein
MSIFTKDEKLEDVTPEVSKVAQAGLKKFIEDNPLGQDPNLPTRQIAGQTELQKRLVAQAGGQIEGGDFGIARDAFRTAATADTDVRGGSEFAANRALLDQQEADQRTSIRQRGTSLGQLRSTPTAALESENTRRFDIEESALLSRLQRQAEQDKLSGAAGLAELGSQRLGDIARANQIADQERVIEQAQADATYNQALQTVLFPYQEQLRLFSVATGIQAQSIMTGGGLTDLGFASTTLASAAGAAAGAA